MAEVEVPNHEELEELKKNDFSKRIALVIGTILMINGYFLLFSIPFFH